MIRWFIAVRPKTLISGSRFVDLSPDLNFRIQWWGEDLLVLFITSETKLVTVNRVDQ